MINSSKYWNYATIAALPVGLCNVLPNYMDHFFSTNQFSNFGLLWKMVTSFLILMYVGKKMLSQENEFTYGQSFKWCYLTCLLSSIVEGFLSILYMKVVDPGYLDKLRNLVMQVLEQNPAYSSQMLDSVNSSLNTFLSPSGILLSNIFSAAICGAIMSLIVACAIRKKPDYSKDIEEEE